MSLGEIIVVEQVLDEFYETMKTVGVSASTGMGMEALFKAIEESKEEYYEFYHKELQQRAQVLSVARP